MSDDHVLQTQNNTPHEIYQKGDGSWWHADETWSDEFGPFTSLFETEQHLTDYCVWLDTGYAVFRDSHGNAIMVQAWH